jgi:phenol 2-monooxygenase
MQFYLDGFRGGDPDIKNAAPNRREYSPHAPLPEKVDVLIAGTGPAGLCLAAQLSQFPEIDTMIVERDPRNIAKGKADGINTRTMEMFQAFGFAEKVKRESYWVNQTSFWTPDPDNPAHIRRIDRVQDVADDSSEMPHILINQARLHQLFLDVMKNSPSRLEPHYSWSVKDLEVDPSTDDHPVTVTLEDTGVNWGQTVKVRANYVVGCDGARSNVRKAIGGELHGDAAHQAWGVMDILANTDFPDVRQKCLISSASEGNVLILPREGGYLFRMYVELDKLNPDERVANRNLTVDHMIAAANRIMAPYTIDVKEVVWWSIYEIGHRISDRFDDVPEGETATRNPRVFTAGDACHTHSPKAGQGMNVSMQDGFNLGWKLAHVFRGWSDPSLLHSYKAERLNEARRLVETDHKWARIMSEPMTDAERAGKEEPRFIRNFKANLEFTGGLAVKYDTSALTGPATHQALATGQEIGRRFHSAPVVRVSDAMRMQLGHAARSRRPLAHLRLRRKGRRLGAGLGDPQARRLARKRSRLPGGEIHPQGRGYRRADRPARGVPANLRRPRLRGHAAAAQAPQGPARSAGSREGLLRRPQGRGRHLRDARDRPRQGLHGGGAPRPVCRPCPAAGCICGPVGVLRRVPAAGRKGLRKPQPLVGKRRSGRPRPGRATATAA